jgi:hypothetical protein
VKDTVSVSRRKPIFGYRAFRLTEVRGVFRPAMRSSSRRYRIGRAYTDKDPAMDTHRGFYALTRERSARTQYPSTRSELFVYAKVALWGNVVRHRYDGLASRWEKRAGYRAQCMRIEALL